MENPAAMQTGGWIAFSRGASAAQVRLFCLPHAGAGAAGYFRWRRLLPEWIEVCPVLLPGRETRIAEPPVTSVETVVVRLVEALAAGSLFDRPFALFGHSMGALIAFELARGLKAADLPAPAELFVSGRCAPQMPFSHRDYHTLPDLALLEALRSRYGGVPESMFTDPELRALFLPALRADLTLVERHRWRDEPTLHCPIHAFAGRLDSSVSDAGLSRWGELTGGAFQAQRVEGDHFCHFGAGQSELLRRIEASLRSRIVFTYGFGPRS
jgi:medium-chain acyl-[acyl-carrier-protein] hydrolase